jgi:hypothetical protein
MVDHSTFKIEVDDSALRRLDQLLGKAEASLKSVNAELGKGARGAGGMGGPNVRGGPGSEDWASPRVEPRRERRSPIGGPSDAKIPVVDELTRVFKMWRDLGKDFMRPGIGWVSVLERIALMFRSFGAGGGAGLEGAAHPALTALKI